LELIVKKLRYLNKLLIVLLICNIGAITVSLRVMAKPLTNSLVNQKAIKQVIDGTHSEAIASWWGFNELDSTQALQAAVLSKAKKIIVPYMGKPWIVGPIYLESDKEIIFEKGVIIIAKSGAFRGRTEALFSAINKSNISLDGYGSGIVMRKQDYMQPPYEKAEWRHCVAILGCKNINIYGLRLAYSGGDGIYIGRGSGKDGTPNSDNIHIKDVICDNNYRQGISIISASNLLIENCQFSNTSGTIPQSGIDFEPNYPDEVLIKCKVTSCIFSNNSGWGISIYLPNLNRDSKSVSIEIEGSRVFGNKKGAVSIVSKNAKDFGDPRGSILIKGCRIDGQVIQQKTQLIEIKIEK
jgi:hypothetical protein